MGWIMGYIINPEVDEYCFAELRARRTTSRMISEETNEYELNRESRRSVAPRLRTVLRICGVVVIVLLTMRSASGNSKRVRETTGN